MPWRSLAWSLGLSLAVLGGIGYYTFDLAAFRHMLGAFNPLLLGAALGTLVLRVFFGAWRLQYVSGGRLSLMHGLRGQLAWDFFSNITPSAVGGGPFATVYIARDRGIAVGEASAVMLFTMLLDQLWMALTVPLLLGAALWLDVFPASIGRIGTGAFVAYFVGLLAWVVGFGYLVLFRPDLIQRLVDGLFRLRPLRRFRGRVVRELQQLRLQAQLLRGQPLRFHLAGFALTMGTWLSRYLLVVFVVWGVYPELDKTLALLRGVALTLGSLLLPTPGGSGGLEGLYALFIGPLMPATLMAPTLFLWRFLGYYLFIALGVALWMHGVHRTLRRGRSARLGGDGHAAALPLVEAAEASP